ncbi:MAG: (cytosine-5-)-methyltransferase [Ilumatobacteraceae bacterium]|nr:(cytosine-5-)-methyltransferase [Ilumatobacteraceae bacterium]
MALGNGEKAKNVDQRPVAVDIFCGAGGMSLGFEQAGFDVLAAVDNDPVHLAVHERNFPLAHVVCDDVATVPVESIHAAIRKSWALHKRAGEWDGTIDCLFGGPSCQGFSDMGRQRVDDERNDLIFAFARLVEDLKPRSFVIENVPGLLFAKVRERLDLLQSRLQLAGYDLQLETPVRLDASDFGVPQFRERVFIVGVLRGLALPKPPVAGVAKKTSVAEALDDLPNVDRFAQLVSRDLLKLSASELKAMEQAGSTYAASLRSLYMYEYERLWMRTDLSGCQRTDHAMTVRRRFADVDEGALDKTSRTHRLASDSQSRTLRAGTGRDHGSYTAPRPIHHRYDRVVTVREAARLHSFPDWFAFNVAKWHALREIGNAVPPRLAASVAATLMAPLGFKPQKPSRVVELGPADLLRHSLRTAADHFGFDKTKLAKDVRRPKKESKTAQELADASEVTA